MEPATISAIVIAIVGAIFRHFEKRKLTKRLEKEKEEAIQQIKNNG